MAVNDPYADGVRSIRNLRENLQLFDDDSSDEEFQNENLLFQQGAPSTRSSQRRWAAKYNLFYRSKEKDGPIKMTIDYLIQFLTRSVKFMRMFGRNSVCYLAVVQGMKHTINYAIHDLNYELTAQHKLRLKSWLTKMLLKKRIHKGRTFPVNRLTFAVLNRIMAKYLNLAITKGTRSFDQIFMELLGISLVAGCACRNGDITRAPHYDEEYLKYKHIELYLQTRHEDKDEDDDGDDDGDDYEEDVDWNDANSNSTIDHTTKEIYKILRRDLRCKVTLLYQKGSKDQGPDDLSLHQQSDNIRIFKVLQSQPYMCVISTLLVHCFRNNLIKGSPKCLKDLYSILTRSKRKRVQWKFPDYPVVCSIDPSTSRNPQELKKNQEAYPNHHGFGKYLNLAHPAQNSILLRAIRRMALMAKLKGYIRVHSIRYGLLRDISTLAGPGQYTANARTAKYAHHSAKSVAAGVTDKYIGPSEEQVYYKVAKQRSELTEYDMHFSEKDFVKKPHDFQETNKVVNDIKVHDKSALYNTFSNDDAHLQRRASYHLEKKDLERYWKEEDEEEEEEEEEEDYDDEPINIPVSRTSGDISGKTIEGKRKVRRIIVDDEIEEEAHKMPDNTKISVKASGNSIDMDGEGYGHSDEENDECDSEDGAKIDEMFENLNERNEKGAIDTKVSDNFLEEEIDQEEVDKLEEEAEEVFRSIHSKQGFPKSFGMFVDSSAKLNITKNDQFSRKFKAYDEKKNNFHSTIGKHSVIGNSRDFPTPFTFRCSKSEGCKYTTIDGPSMKRHESTCTPQKVKKINNARQRMTPEQKERRFTCAVENCGKSFATANNLSSHKNKIHTPTSCKICFEKVIGSNGLRAHKKKVHGANG